MQPEFCAGTAGPPAAACLHGGHLMPRRDGGEMMSGEKLEPFSRDAIRAAVTRRPRLRPPRSAGSSSEFKLDVK